MKHGRLIMRGDVGIPVGHVDRQEKENLTSCLTREARAWDENPSETVTALREDGGYLWVPRYYDTDLWREVSSFEWTEGDQYDFKFTAALDPERGQVAAVPEMIEHIRENLGGILVAPTGTGKTIMGYAIAAAFKRKIGIPIYVGHMIDNWIEHAKTCLGLAPEDIGLYREDRCDIGKPVTLFSVQTILSRGLPLELQRQIGFLVCDEVHRYGAKVWREIVACFPAKYRLGLSANPVRKDGLDDLIFWSFGRTGHRAERIRTELAQPPKVVFLFYEKGYEYRQFCKWRKIHGEWHAGEPHPVKYDKAIATDRGRTLMLASEIANALKKGRQVLIFSRFVDHLDQLRADTVRWLDPVHPIERLVKNLPYPEDHRFPRTAVLRRGMSKEERERVVQADAIFATYVMARDALNVPKLDTLFFATPPGDPLQPIGRLREKVEWIERRPLLVIDCYEDPQYARDKARARREDYRKRGSEVQELTRAAR